MTTDKTPRFVSPEERKEILRTLIETKGDYNKTCHKLGVPLAIVRWVDIVENKKFSATEEDLGKPELIAYIVAVKYPVVGSKDFGPWDNSDQAIIEARRLYDKGVVELVTRKTSRTMILYALPRRVPVIRDKYFVLKLEEEEEVV